jgi:hypothetical protein
VTAGICEIPSVYPWLVTSNFCLSEYYIVFPAFKPLPHEWCKIGLYPTEQIIIYNLERVLMAAVALAPNQLIPTNQSRSFEFETTDELEDLSEIIGQPRAVDAVRFGLRINKGYNIFALGPAEQVSDPGEEFFRPTPSRACLRHWTAFKLHSRL